MKKFFGLITIMALMFFANPALALDFVSKVPFSNISAASAAVKTSSVFNVTGYRPKTLFVSGVTLTSSLTAITFKNMSGTLIAQCAPATTGPWSTCGQGQSSAGAAVSFTSNGLISWTDAVSYVRLQWTSGTIGGKLKAWLNYVAP